MIKANELRVGNWVIDPVDGRMKTTNIYQIGKHQIDDTNTNYLPIPLTPEILEKAGFVKYQYGGNNQFEGYKVRWSKDSIYGFLTSDNIFALLGFERRHQNIKYLHQLQNLYFALTGEELEINL